MLKKLFFFLFLTAGYIYTFGQNSILFMPIWQQGETHTFSISEIKVKVKSTDGGETYTTVSEDTNTYIAHFEILDVTDELYRIKMSYENNIDEVFNDLDIDSIHFTIPEEYQEVDVIYTCDRNGLYQQIENVEEIQKNMKLLLDSILLPIAQDNPLLLGMFSKITQMYSTPEAIQTTAYKELQMLHFLYGSEMENDYTYSMQEFLPNIITEEPLRATTVIYIDTINSEQSLCTVKRYSSINKKDAKKLVKLFFKTLSFNKGMKKVMSKMEMSIEDDYTWDFSTLLNIPLNISAKRYSSVIIGQEENLNLEELQINLIE